MKIIINHSSMQPIYEQITDQIKAMIIDGTLKEEEMLPSVRTLAKELKISALTVKKAYDFLEEEGFVVTVHGKGSFIAKNNQGLLMEERKREIETELEEVIRKARISGLSEEEIRELFELIMEEFEEFAEELSWIFPGCKYGNRRRTDHRSDRSQWSREVYYL